jgi:hypothetical protein
MSKLNDKAEEEKKSKAKKPPEYRRFEKLLKQVVKAPPLRPKLAQVAKQSRHTGQPSVETS